MCCLDMPVKICFHFKFSITMSTSMQRFSYVRAHMHHQLETNINNRFYPSRICTVDIKVSTRNKKLISNSVYLCNSTQFWCINRTGCHCHQYTASHLLLTPNHRVLLQKCHSTAYLLLEQNTAKSCIRHSLIG